MTTWGIILQSIMTISMKIHVDHKKMTSTAVSPENQVLGLCRGKTKGAGQKDKYLELFTLLDGLENCPNHHEHHHPEHDGDVRHSNHSTLHLPGSRRTNHLATKKCSNIVKL